MSIIDLKAIEINNSRVDSDIVKEEKVASEAAKRLNLMADKVSSFYGTDDAQDYGKAVKQINQALEMHGAMDAIILGNAANLMISEKMSITEILMTKDSDLMRAAVLLPSSRHMILKGKEENIQRMREGAYSGDSDQSFRFYPIT